MIRVVFELTERDDELELGKSLSRTIDMKEGDFALLEKSEKVVFYGMEHMRDSAENEYETFQIREMTSHYALNSKGEIVDRFMFVLLIPGPLMSIDSAADENGFFSGKDSEE